MTTLVTGANASSYATNLRHKKRAASLRPFVKLADSTAPVA